MSARGVFVLGAVVGACVFGALRAGVSVSASSFGFFKTPSGKIVCQWRSRRQSLRRRGVRCDDRVEAADPEAWRCLSAPQLRRQPRQSVGDRARAVDRLHW